MRSEEQREPENQVQPERGANSSRARHSDDSSELVDPTVKIETSAQSDGLEDVSAFAGTERFLEALREYAGRKQRYGVEKEVGRGAMGKVLRAWDRPLRRHLALKVVRDELQAGGKASDPTQTRVVQRFVEEAQITGQLDHPGIVPVHELGVDDEGRLFFSMRLVRGRDLERVLEKYREGDEDWTLPRILSVLLRVAEAVTYAHAKGVIHRDLKPSNIMIGRFGEVYVMDWGLAKAAGRPDPHDLRPAASSVETVAELHTLRSAPQGDESGSTSPLLTVDGTALGTPSFMSPEQARGELERLDHRSDVYSLGAVLYDILAGQAPYAPKGARISAQMILWRVIEGPPTPLSKLNPKVAPELDAITSKAMAREPEERYQSLEEFARDLQAFLEGRVVRAYRVGAIAELKSWVHRNVALAATILLASIVVLGGSIGASAVLANRNKDLESAEEQARRESNKASANLELLKSLLTSSNARAGKRGDLTVQEFLQQALDRIREMDLMPEVRASVLTTLGLAHQSLGLLAQAEPPLLEATELWRSLGPEAHDELAEALYATFELTIQQKGEGVTSLEEAEEISHELFKIIKTDPTKFADDFEPLQGSLTYLRTLISGTEVIPDEFFRYVRDQLEQRGFSRPLEELRGEITATIFEAGMLVEQGELEQARLRFHAYLEPFLDDGDLRIVIATQRACAWLIDVELFSSAVALCLENLYLLDETAPESSLHANISAQLAWALTNCGKPEAGITTLEAAVERTIALHGEEIPAVFETRALLGHLLNRTARFVEAEAVLRAALRWADAIQEQDRQKFNCKSSLAAALVGQGRLQDARQTLVELIRQVTAFHPPGHKDELLFRRQLAEVELDLGRASDAEAQLLVIIDGWSFLEGEQHPNTLDALEALARLYLDAGRSVEALECSTRLLNATAPDAPEHTARTSLHQLGLDASPAPATNKHE